MARAYLSLGSNLDPERHLAAALAELEARFGPLTVSPVYRSAAVGFDGADFLNLALGLDTELDPVALDAWLHALEDRHGRRRDQPRYSSRTLDADIVLYDALVLRGPGHLEIPRPELHHAFVLRPLADIAPDTIDPVSGKSLAQLWQEFPGASEPLHEVRFARSGASVLRGRGGD
jgi:2-amino-4-hydroxy-6-hydroxymethyldihydropteridine diphosphokinase